VPPTPEAAVVLPRAGVKAPSCDLDYVRAERGNLDWQGLRQRRSIPKLAQQVSAPAPQRAISLARTRMIPSGGDLHHVLAERRDLQRRRLGGGRRPIPELAKRV
jgi:hypothetical protein